MRYLIALFFPWISFFTIGKVGRGIICLLLQMTIIGWLPAVIWAFMSISNYYSDKRTDRLVQAIEANRPPPPLAPSVRDFAPALTRMTSIPAASIPATPRAVSASSDSFAKFLSGSPSRKSPPAKIEVLAPEPPPNVKPYNERKWRALVRFDDEIAAAAETLRALGGRWEDELAKAYLQLNDKTYLSVIAQKLVAEAQSQSA